VKSKIIGKLQHSLFLKILLVFITSYIIIILVPIFSHRLIFQGPRFSRVPGVFVGYSKYVVESLGFPPDTLSAHEFADSAKIQIRFADDRINWASQTGVPRFNELSFIRENMINAITYAGYLKDKKGLAVLINDQKGRYLIVFTRPERETFLSAAQQQTIILVICSTLIIIGVYFFIRWLLKPIKTLHEGVEEVAGGNLTWQIETRRKDELGQLALSFNSMTRRIREMLHARDQLLLDVSHELRSPLTRMKVALEFMEDSSARESLREDIIETENMVTEILETERLKSSHGSLKLEKLNLSPLLKSVCNNFTSQKPGINLHDIPEKLLVQGDSERLHMVFKNIISNALKYSNTQSKPVQISARKTEDHIILEIRDFGMGIPENELPYIFEPFYRVDKSRTKKTGGYGLGLNLSRKIMDAHGGIIEISSKINIGTSVSLKFKRGQAEG
jgi:signal transduction histidine kinase